MGAGVRGGGAVLAALSILVLGCDSSRKTVEPPATPEPAPPQTPRISSRDAGTPPSGAPAASSAPDGGTLDAGTPPDAGPWPKDALLDYTQQFGLGTPQSAGLDEALNLWLLDGTRIGVLRPGDQAPTWTSGVGQAREGFGWQSLATGSTVICGGAAGRAYVGYSALELEYAPGIVQRTWIPNPGDSNYTPERYAEYQKGDMDAVRLQPDGTVALEEHLWRTPGPSNEGRQIGIHNTNDFHYDEDRSVRNCARVTRGPYRGDVYITTNHGVTMIQGLRYNSHRHAAWYVYEPGNPWGSLQTPETYGLGIAPNGDVLIGNEQMVGILVPNGNLEDFDTDLTWEGPVPWRFKGFNDALGSLGSNDYWRAFEQTASGRYYLGSAYSGLWELKPTGHSSAAWSKLSGLPTDAIPALKATDDGALYIGTGGAGLWRLEPDGVTLQKVEGVAGGHVLQMVYEPTVTPSMLLVLTDHGLTVIRGP